MFVQIIILILGLALIVLGADFMVDGASGIARRAGLSEFAIGLIIVGFGTSCPELVVSLSAAISGNADISVGNVIGSNIFNVLMILGLSAVVAPIPITESNRKSDIPIGILVTLLFFICGKSYSLFALGSADRIGRPEGVLFLCVFVAYVYFCFRSGKQAATPEDEGGQASSLKARVTKSLFGCIVMVIGGIAGLAFGGRLFVNSAIDIAAALGVSDKFIAITVLAAGTSLPELATSVIAAAKGKGQMALGNILGSNIFNILLILGCSALVTPLSMDSINYVDISVLLLSVILIFVFSQTGKRDKIGRAGGAVMLLCFVAYFIYLFRTL